MAEGNPIVGHKTWADGSHTPLYKDEADAIWVAVEAEREKRAADMPTEVEASPAIPDIDWRHKLWMVACHASGGGIPEIEGVDLPINDICVQISAHHNAIWKHAQEAALRDQPTPASHSAPEHDDRVALDTLSDAMKEIERVRDGTTFSDDVPERWRRSMTNSMTACWATLNGMQVAILKRYPTSLPQRAALTKDTTNG